MKKLALTVGQIVCIQTTFQQIPAGSNIMDLLYEKLFELKPELQPLFKHLDKQKEKLAETITALIANLEDITPLMPEIERLGKMHSKFATAEDYKFVGEALIYALKTVLTPYWGTMIEESYIAMYAGVAELMQKA